MSVGESTVSAVPGVVITGGAGATTKVRMFDRSTTGSSGASAGLAANRCWACTRYVP